MTNKLSELIAFGGSYYWLALRAINSNINLKKLRMKLKQNLSKLAQKYFLLASKDPGLSSLFAFLTILILTVIVGKLFHSWQDGESITTVLLIGFILSYALATINYFLVLVIRRKFITMPDDTPKARLNYLFQVALFEDGIIILKKPIWGKGVKFAILRPAGLKEQVLEIKTSIISRHEGRGIEVPVTLKISLAKAFDEAKLFLILLKRSKALVNYHETTELSLEEYLIKVFYDFNEPSSEKIKDLSRAYLRGEIADPVFSKKLLKILDFPRKIFSNVAYTAIQIDCALCKAA